MLRKVLVTVVGHVDHGKSSLLDYIRGTSVVTREAGAITQAIGASIIPLESIRKVCGPLLDKLKTQITIPGILAIDTPGHAAFTNLRKRGGALADIAIVVIDINEGFMPQTEEAIEILRASKTPFVIAANKIDLIHGWKSLKEPLLSSLSKQDPATTTNFETKMYEIVGRLYEKFQLNAERFDRVDDYTKTIAIVPLSAKTGEGMPELLMVLMGLAQRYLEQTLKIDVAGPAKGTVLEVKEEKGLGVTLDVIIYDGTLRVNDTIVIGGLEAPVVTKVKALFEPAPLAEMREKKTRYSPVKEACAATGIKIGAKEIETVISGMPIEAVPAGAEATLEEVKTRIQSQIDSVVIETDQTGVVIKADALGSLEAMISLLRDAQVPIKRASIGPISKKDVLDAEANREGDPLLAVVLGFNVKLQEHVDPGAVKVLISEVIYKIIEDYDSWKKAQTKAMVLAQLDTVSRPYKLEILRGYVFRQSNPAVVGVEVQAGTVRSNTQVMKKDGKALTSIKSIELEKESVEKAEKGKQVAISMPHVIIGRQLNEGDVLYSFLTEEEFRKLKEFKETLSADERETMKEIAEIMRKENPVWGI